MKDKKFLIDFAQNMKELYFNEGQKIYEKGDIANYFYVIKDGSVKFCSIEEPEISFMELGAGNYFGEYDILEDEKRKYCVFCKEDTTIFRISKFIFIDLFVNGDRTVARVFKEVA
jgi:CRP-like cAMP-binding protein